MTTDIPTSITTGLTPAVTRSSFQVDGNWAGFALVREIPPYDLAEFFVMRKYRRLGFGRQAAVAVFTKFPGRWQVRQQLTNPEATAFWHAAIPFAYTERETRDEIIQEFTSRPLPLAARREGGPAGGSGRPSRC